MTDDLVQAAVAAAYEKAAVAAVDYVNAFLNAEEWTTCGVYNHITALIIPDAQAALDRVVSARFGVVRSEVVRLSVEGKIDREAAERLLAAIRKGRE